MPTLLDCIEIESAPHPTAAIIWMHGLGADATDFVTMPRELDLRGMPGIRFVFPRAPVMPVTISNGYVMRAWFDIHYLGSAPPQALRRENEDHLRAAQVQVEALIAREVARGIPASRIFLAGFSQGSAMTLQTGLRHPEALGGLICLSGWVPLDDKLDAERHPANQGVPIFMGHGRYDDVIPLSAAQRSRDILSALGYQVQWKEYPMAHSVCGEEVAHISAWLQTVLA